MLNDIQDGKDDVSYVLVFKLSRFGRNAADVLNSLQLMQDFGVNLICVEDGIDSSKDAGKLMISVLSAVAEIERENIRTQTMAGREQKAREGKWNGGFAPYGYKLENGNLVIAEDEVEVIRVIYDRYIHTNEGVAGVAKYLNRNGYTKKLRQNNTIPGFSRDFVKNVLYNPVYMGKIAYGRRRTEKKQGTRNEMHVVEQSEFPVYEGQHEAIISEEDWYLVQEKRKINSFKREKVNNPDHAHILSGILKCPCCGKSMYGNIAKAHSKDKKTRYYYYCKNTVTPTGHECSFRLNIEQTEINKFVAKVISAMVNNPRFVEAIQAKIGTAVDTEDMERQIAVLQGRLKQAFGTKSRLERQMDTLDINDAHYDRKILDLQRRYDEQYDTIEEIEVQIGELQSQIRSIQQEKISGDNIYRLLLAFDEVYHSATEAEQKEFMKAFIERIEMFPEKRKDGSWIKKIVFNFPVPVDGEEVKELPLETETTVETVSNGQFMMVKRQSMRKRSSGFASMWNMDGIVVIGFCNQDYSDLRSHMRIPFVVYDGDCAHPERIVNITIDNFDGGYQVGRHFRELGHAAALCISDNAICVDRKRFQGILRRFCPRKGRAVGGFHAEGAALGILPGTAAPAAAGLCHLCGIGLLRHRPDAFLTAHGFSVPGDVSITGFDDTPMCEMVHPALTTVRQDGALRAKLPLKRCGSCGRAHTSILRSDCRSYWWCAAAPESGIRESAQNHSLIL